jgi:hypothetical protein
MNDIQIDKLTELQHQIVETREKITVNHLLCSFF